MVQGAGRPGQPNIGQRSIFGNGGPSFAQMPSFTPVTRGGQQPAAPRPAPVQPQNPSAPQAASARPQGYADPATQGRPQAAQPRPAQPNTFGGGQQFTARPQAFAAPGAPQNHGFNNELPDFGNVDSGFPDSIFGDLKVGAHAEESGAALAEEGFQHGGFPEEGASFSEVADEMSYQGAPMGYEAEQAPADAYQPEAYAGHQQVPAAEDMSYYAQQGVPYGHVPPADPSRQLQAFDSTYGQPPQIPLGDAHAAMQHGAQDYHGGHDYHGGQDYFEANRGDADFMDAGRRIGTLGLPTVFCMEGGYAIEAVGVNAVNVLEGYQDA